MKPQPALPPQPPSSPQRGLSDRESVDFELLDLIEREPGLSQRELSERLGISLGRVNYCLKALADRGWLKLINFRNSPSKLRYVYTVTPSGLAQRASIARRFLRRKIAEFERLKMQIERLERELPDE